MGSGGRVDSRTILSGYQQATGTDKDMSNGRWILWIEFGVLWLVALWWRGTDNGTRLQAREIPTPQVTGQKSGRSGPTENNSAMGLVSQGFVLPTNLGQPVPHLWWP
jgi:hypothetical protein